METIAVKASSYVLTDDILYENKYFKTMEYF
jgi:hypothetical protein